DPSPSAITCASGFPVIAEGVVCRHARRFRPGRRIIGSRVALGKQQPPRAFLRLPVGGIFAWVCHGCEAIPHLLPRGPQAPGGPAAWRHSAPRASPAEGTLPVPPESAASPPRQPQKNEAEGRRRLGQPLATAEEPSPGANTNQLSKGE